jgi:FixJ family two-component response regulator
MSTLDLSAHSSKQVLPPRQALWREALCEMMEDAQTRPASSSGAPLVLVVDDESGVRSALNSLLRSVGYVTKEFESAHELLESEVVRQGNCIILDIRLPRVSGLEFQAQLARIGINTPIIFMTGHGDIPMSVRAMKAGAIDFLQKPFREQDMLDAVSAAIERDKLRREGNCRDEEQARRYQTLSERERQIMSLASSGLMNKQIAFQLGLAEITVKIHRGHVMRKMGARTFADLVRMADGLGLLKRNT